MRGSSLPGPVLGISAAGPSAVGLVGPGLRARRLVHDSPRAHVESLVPLVAQLLAEAGLEPRNLAAVAVGRGPAPYTGLRIALASAQTLAFALSIPVWGVSDLDVLAADAAVQRRLQSGVSILAALDAKRREVYWARYRVDAAGRIDGLTRLEGPGVGRAAAVPAASVTVGAGVEKYLDELGPVTHGEMGVDPVVLARLAAVRAARGEDVSSEPLYLRRPDVSAPGSNKWETR
ncbi:MAG: tRNA (adenosine(37)-N6)-threonylcarbamoyltransferase complex dimerization subunit type 1 TsaB [Bifidobacteriaceae bacterium]|nr:tRNA (adenosine(37)-N6)-threonylcarbamoyltransferase complex dimerization subunit type 1 TsaB [Bifidobacteriaceae bacterium]